MTERGPFTGMQGMRGAPGPAEPSHTGDPPGQAGPPPPVAGLPADLSAVRRTDAILDSLAARRAAGSAARSATPSPTASTTAPESTAAPETAPETAPEIVTGTGGAAASEGGRCPHQADDHDPAVRLLHALITDVDDPCPGCEAGPGAAPPTPPGPGSRRRGPRTIVALGVAGAVLASTGVAAAGDGTADRPSAAPAPRTAATPGTGTGTVPGEAGGPAVADTDAGFHDSGTAVPVRAVPDPERPAPRKPPGDRAEDDPAKSRVRYLYPRQPRPRRQDYPTMTTYGAPPSAYGASPRGTDDTRRTPTDFRPRTGKRTNPYQNHHGCDD